MLLHKHIVLLLEFSVLGRKLIELGFEVFLELEWRIKLYLSVMSKIASGEQLTCERGTTGGPDAMLADLVPGRILRVEPSFCPIATPSRSVSLAKESPTDGD